MSDLHVIVGLGETGLSCAHYLKKRGISFAINDTRAAPPHLPEIKKYFPDIELSLGKLDEDLLERAAEIILSPGLSLKEPAIAKQVSKGKSVIGDIELFVRETTAPIIAITGTNAKSTVTTLVGLMAERAGVKVKVGGNLGTPALDLLTEKNTELFVLELSSFQLETTHSLKAAVATVLNVTPDHMDRYENVAAYQAAKKRIYKNCRVAVCNRDDVLTEDENALRKFYFSLNEPNKNEFGISKNFLAFENNLLLATRELPVLGKHYQANALASLAMGHAWGLPMDAMLQTLREFKGLPHRCQFVREINGVYWYNDSKGTNVGATLAAIEGLGSEITGKIILIAGGLGKNADFSLLTSAIKKYIKTLVLIGEAAPLLADVFKNEAEIVFANSMEEAVKKSFDHAKKEDLVLLSPACASWDMFKNFEHRGDVFTQAVLALKE